MEQENKQAQVNEEMDAMMEQMKKDVTAQVTDMLKNKGITVIPNDYSAEKEMVEIVEKYQATIKKLDAEMKHNEETYKADIVKMKNIELQLDKNDALYEANKKLDDIIKKQEKVQQQKIESLQGAKDYKDNKMEALQMLSLIKDAKDIPTETLMLLIEPLVNAQDVKTLGIAKVMLQGNALASHTLAQTIDGINIANENRELRNAIDIFKRYLQDGNETLTVFNYMKKFRK